MAAGSSQATIPTWPDPLIRATESRRIPHDRSPESTLALLMDPYGFIARRCRRYGTDLFQARIMLQPTLCMTGREAAQLFYNPEYFLRKGAPPARLQATLFGRGGVQGLDDAAHRHRKSLFIALAAPERVAHLAAVTAGVWEQATASWTTRHQVVLYDEVREVLCRSVCAWSGVPLPESEVRRRTSDLTALFDQGTLAGPRHWWARFARWRTDRWLAEMITQIRSRRLHAPQESAAFRIAWHRELDGELLEPHVAAVELGNILRPTVAVAVFITFAALALHRHPESRSRLANAEDEYAELFAQEVRRYYPFFPAVAARVRQDFVWQGYHFPQGQRVMLDLYGTNHDPRWWEAPETFKPERFRDRPGSLFDFIPQGGGDPHRGHRCPGEGITLALIEVALDFLSRRLAYEVPEQDLRINTSRLPALPRSRFVIRNVRPSVSLR